MRSVAITAVVAALISTTVSGPLAAQTPPTMGAPGGGPVRVVVNSQKSLAEAVGADFRDEAWEHPAKLLPDNFPGLIYVSGPADRDAAPKAAWRKPVALRDKVGGVDVAINCYRAGAVQEKGFGPGSPFAPLLESDYRYAKAEFHGLRAASASDGERDVFAFRDGDRLFKVEAAGGKSESRRKATRRQRRSGSTGTWSRTGTPNQRMHRSRGVYLVPH
jgi:hypothetical protein